MYKGTLKNIKEYVIVDLGAVTKQNE